MTDAVNKQANQPIHTNYVDPIEKTYMNIRILLHTFLKFKIKNNHNRQIIQLSTVNPFKTPVLFLQTHFHSNPP